MIWNLEALPLENQLLTDWFAQKNLDDTVIFKKFIITDTIKVRTITDEINPLQSGGVFSYRAKLTGAQNKHRVLYTLKDDHRDLQWGLEFRTFEYRIHSNSERFHVLY